MAILSKAQRLCLGLFVLLLVDVIWVSSSELTEVLFKDEKYSKPFFSTYCKTSKFIIYLSGFFLWKPWRDLCRRNVVYTYIDPNQEESAIGDDESLLSDSMFVPIKFHDGGDKSSGTESDESSSALANNRAVRFSKLTEVRQLSDSQAEDAILSRLSYTASLRAQDAAQRLANKLSVKQVAHVAVMFTLVWFLANFSYQEALADTEAGVVNVLSSGSGIFTLVLSALFPANSGDKFTLSKLLAVMLSISGVVIVSLSDLKATGDGTIPMGSIWAVQSAVFYAAYLVFLRRKVESEDKMDIPMFFGFVGVFNLLFLWPGLLLVHYTGLESFQWPTSRQWLYLVINGLVGTVFSEFLWLWGCFLTSSLIGTLSLTLTIPMTVIADMLLRHKNYDLLFFLGTIPTIVAFIATGILAHYDNWDPIMEGLRHLFQIVCHRKRIVRVRDGDREQTESLIGINNNDEHYA